MKCKNHPNRDAKHFCASCSIPICDECTEETESGQYFCFQCAMLQAVSVVGSSLSDKRERGREKKLEIKKEWGPFRFFVIASSVVIAVMWGVILFGGEKSPGSKIDPIANPRIFLFMVDSSIKRYAHFEGNKYPETLMDLVPKYISFKKDDISYLNSLSYSRDPNLGYTLSFANPRTTDMNIIISAKGITYGGEIKEEAVK